MASGNVVVDRRALLESRGGALIPSREIGNSKAEPRAGQRWEQQEGYPERELSLGL